LALPPEALGRLEALQSFEELPASQRLEVFRPPEAFQMFESIETLLRVPHIPIKEPAKQVRQNAPAGDPKKAGQKAR
jgi:hypothetical protein